MGLGLVVTLLYCCQHAIAGGTLDFLHMPLASTLQRGDDRFGNYVRTTGGFEFGTGKVFGVYVSVNGYFAMGSYHYPLLRSFPGPSRYSVVAPFAADIDTSNTGSVRYTDFGTYHPQKSAVNDFIRNQAGKNFHGTSMMVAEWNSVPLYSGLSSITNTFQGILITDGSSSYAVFIYECGGMKWGGGVIGWQASTSDYESHVLSGSIDADGVGCLYSATYSAIVYRLDVASCYDFQFLCDNEKCVSKALDKCDGVDDCGDNSDEEGCVIFDVRLAVGLSVGLFSLLLFIFICLSVTASCYNEKRRSRVQIPVVSTTPSMGGNTHGTSSQPTLQPTLITQPPYELQPVYKDAQLSSHNAPPSYAAAITFPSCATPQPLQYQTNLIAVHPPEHNIPYAVQNQVHPPANPLHNQADPLPIQADPLPTQAEPLPIQAEPQPGSGDDSGNNS